jgi:exopolysaccharide biosynthesis polyprenyl glycosylphosphotransferase
MAVNGSSATLERARDRRVERAPATPPLVVAARHRPRDYRTRRRFAIADAASVVTGLVVLAIASGSWAAAVWGAATLPAWIIVFKGYGLYDRGIKTLTASLLDDLPWILHGLLVGSVGLWVLYSQTPIPDVPFRDVALFAVACLGAMVTLRPLARRSIRASLGPERVLLLGDGPELAVLERKLRDHPEYGAEPVGFVATSGGPRGGRVLSDSLDDLELIIADEDVERVVVAHCAVGEDALMDVLRRVRALGVKASVLPQLFDVMGPSVEVDVVEGVTTLSVVPPVFTRSSRIIKRSMDVAGSVLLLTALAPVMAVIALAVRMDSPGPILFRQQRVGRGGRPFELLKFRTMTVDAEARRAELLAQSRDPHWLDLERDPRVTRVGRLLRLSSLDELPQLWNVARGQMSLVGPRPLIPSEDGLLEGWRRSRVDLTPGLTGLWQVLGRTRIPFEEMVKLDYLYVTNWSLWTDVRLILRTLPAVFGRRGAN